MHTNFLYDTSIVCFQFTMRQFKTNFLTMSWLLIFLLKCFSNLLVGWLPNIVPRMNMLSLFVGENNEFTDFTTMITYYNCSRRAFWVIFGLTKQPLVRHLIYLSVRATVTTWYHACFQSSSFFQQFLTVFLFFMKYLLLWDMFDRQIRTSTLNFGKKSDWEYDQHKLKPSPGIPILKFLPTNFATIKAIVSHCNDFLPHKTDNTKIRKCSHGKSYLRIIISKILHVCLSLQQQLHHITAVLHEL